MLAQVCIHKEVGYCRRLCDHNDDKPKPVVRVVVTTESSSHWQSHYKGGLRTLIEKEWSKCGQDYL